MDLEYNDFLGRIMKKHNTDTWNDDCRNDPEYLGHHEFRANVAHEMFNDQVRQTGRIKPQGSFRIGSYKYRSKK